jgi:hypothetical protein
MASPLTPMARAVSVSVWEPVSSSMARCWPCSPPSPLSDGAVASWRAEPGGSAARQPHPHHRHHPAGDRTHPAGAARTAPAEVELDQLPGDHGSRHAPPDRAGGADADRPDTRGWPDGPAARARRSRRLPCHPDHSRCDPRPGRRLQRRHGEVGNPPRRVTRPTCTAPAHLDRVRVTQLMPRVGGERRLREDDPARDASPCCDRRRWSSVPLGWRPVLRYSVGRT